MKFVYFILFLLCCSLAYATDGQVSSFYGQPDPFNVNYVVAGNNSFLLNIPRYSNVTNITFNSYFKTNLRNATNESLIKNSYKNIKYQVISDPIGLKKDFEEWINRSDPFFPSRLHSWNFNISFNISVENSSKDIFWRYSFSKRSGKLGLNSSVYDYSTDTWVLLNASRPSDKECMIIKQNINSTYIKDGKLTILVSSVLESGGAIAGDLFCDGYTVLNGVDFIMAQSNISYGFVNTNQILYLTNEEKSYNTSNERHSNVSINISNINTILKNGCTSETVDGTGCLFNFTLYSAAAGNITINLTNASYEYGIDNCSTYTNPILNFSYFQQNTGEKITVTNGYNLLFSGLFNQYLNGTFTGARDNAICSLVDYDLNWTVTGQVILTKPAYGTQIIDYPSGGGIFASISSVANVSLYMIRLNESSTIQYTWLTSAYQPIDGTMQIFECNGDGSTTLVASIPIVDSLAIGNIELVSQPYSYKVIIDGELFEEYNSYSKCHIESDTTRQYLVTIAGEDLVPIIGVNNIQCNVTKTGANTVKVSWGDNPDDVTPINGCLYASRFTLGSYNQFYYNCTSTTNSIERTIPNSGFNYVVTGKVFQSGYSKLCKNSIEFNFQKSGADNFGLMGLLSVFLLIASMILFFKSSGQSQILGAVIGLVLAWFTGLVAFGWTTISALIFFLIIILYVGRYSRQST